MTQHKAAVLAERARRTRKQAYCCCTRYQHVGASISQNRPSPEACSSLNTDNVGMLAHKKAWCASCVGLQSLLYVILIAILGRCCWRNNSSENNNNSNKQHQNSKQQQCHNPPHFWMETNTHTTHTTHSPARADSPPHRAIPPAPRSS